MARFNVRLSDELAEQVQAAASQRGFENPAAFIRQAITTELRIGGSALREMEERIEASLLRLSREIHKVQTAQQAEYALVDSFVRLFLICTPEPSKEAVTPAKARAATRYENFLRNVASNMVGDARTALAQLLDHD